ncbi:MAG: aminoglycoside phosphotransferase family protein [Candidatus Binataceae bacterium]
MPTEVEAPIREWVADTVRTRWLGARVAHIDPLKGDASTRRFWRVTLDRVNSDTPSSAIAIDLGPDDLPLYARALNLIPEPLVETPWLNLHRFLSAIGAPVPELYHADPNERMLLVEDVGSLPLFEAAAHGDAADLYRLAADQLLKLHLDGTRRLDSDCMASQLAYDARLFRWELEQFVEYGIGTIGTHARRAALVPELDGLAARLGAYPRVFSHRDFHGHNLFLQYRTDADNQAAPRLRIIDFQDALMAPAAQDLAVLLTTRDTSRIITPRIEQRVVEYYYAAMMRRGEAGLAANDFFESYWLCVLQHALKVIGRFIYLEREGKPGYSVYVPYAIAQARRALTHLGGFPILRAAVGD